jgi:tellurite resistance protein TehA-like permease
METDMTAEEPLKASQPYRLDRDKAILDFIRHIATLAGGALAFIAAFVRDNDRIPQWAIVGAVVSFVVAMIAHLFAYLMSIGEFFGRESHEISGLKATWFAIIITVAVFALTIGFVFLGAGAASK